MITITRLCIAIFGIALFVCNSQLFAEGATELQARTAVRVCADPDNLPYSNRLQQGFENKIAELLAETLELPLYYAWFPQSMGFVRTTLRTRQCDVIIGYSAAHELVLNTNPYYKSSFVIIYPSQADYKITSLTDKVLREKNLRIGLIAGTPPSGLLLENGLMTQVAPYHLIVDTRTDSPAEQIIKDMIAGKLDVAVLWGPIAGYFNKQYDSRFEIVSLDKYDSDVHPMVFSITMGIRRGEIEWKRTLNTFMRRNQEKIDAILNEYGVPLLDAR